MAMAILNSTLPLFYALSQQTPLLVESLLHLLPLFPGFLEPTALLSYLALEADDLLALTLDGPAVFLLEG